MSGRATDSQVREGSKKGRQHRKPEKRGDGGEVGERGGKRKGGREGEEGVFTA